MFPQVTGVFDSLNESLKPLTDSAGKFGTEMFKLDYAMQGVSKGFAAVTSAAGLLTAPLQVAVSGIANFANSVTALGTQVSQFVKLANPALVEQFMFAAEDLFAVIGQSLVPVLGFATKFVRMFADAIQVVSGPIAKLLDAFLTPLADLLGAVMQTVSPLLDMFGVMSRTMAALYAPLNTVLVALAKIALMPIEVGLFAISKALEVFAAPLEVVGRLLGEAATAFAQLIDRIMTWVRNLLGIKAIAGGSVGAAVKPASFTGVEEFQRKAIEKAFSLGTAAADPAERTATLADQLLAEVKRLPERMWEYIARLPPDLAKSIIDALNPLAGGGGGLAAAAAVVPGGDVALAASRRLSDAVRGRFR